MPGPTEVSVPPLRIAPGGGPPGFELLPLGALEDSPGAQRSLLAGIGRFHIFQIGRVRGSCGARDM